MTYLLLALFVYGVSAIIDGFDHHFNLGIDRLYQTGPSWRRFIMKPTVYCNVCMSSFWGSIGYFIVMGLNDPFYWVLHVVVCAGLIKLLNQVFDD